MRSSGIDYDVYCIQISVKEVQLLFNSILFESLLGVRVKTLYTVYKLQTYALIQKFL